MYSVAPLSAGKNIMQSDNNPEVSIVIPCYNHGAYIQEALNSVLEQTFKHYEIIIVDDGSSFETKSILQQIRHPLVRIIYQKNAGPSAARNRGARECKGRYILFLDADDKIDFGYLAECYSILEANQEIGIVYCKAEFFGKKKGMWNLPPYSLDEMLKNNIIFISALFRRELFENVGGFDESLVVGYEDYDFWLSIIETGCAVYQIDKVMFYYRKHFQKRQDSRQSRIERLEQFAILRKIQQKHQSLYEQNINVLFEQIELLRQELYRSNEKRKLFKRLFSRFQR